MYTAGRTETNLLLPMYFIRHTARDQNPKHNPQMRRPRAQYSEHRHPTLPLDPASEAAEFVFRSDGVRVSRDRVLSRSKYVPHVGDKQRSKPRSSS